jgi:RNA polymerase-binding transcription factor DksA
MYSSILGKIVNKAQLKKFRESLLALAGRIDTTVAGLEGDVRTPTGGQAGGGLSNAPLHLGDVGSDVASQELGATLLENESYIRGEVSAALERLERATYGRCENCGKQILIARLEALPYVRFCIPCAEKSQSGKLVNLNEGRLEGWLGTRGHESPDATVIPTGANVRSRSSDIHAAGTPGGGTSVGGLAGTNIGTGEPDTQTLENAMGSGNFDVEADQSDENKEELEAYSGPSGGAVGGTPTNKRTRGAKKSRGGMASQDDKRK